MPSYSRIIYKALSLAEARVAACHTIGISRSIVVAIDATHLVTATMVEQCFATTDLIKSRVTSRQVLGTLITHN